MPTAEIETIASHATEFHPRRFLNNGHLQTIAGNYLARVNDLPAPEDQLVEVSPATRNQIASQVLCHCHWQPEEVRATRPTAIIVHGLEGSSDSQYVVGNSNKLWRAGCNIIRMNMRNCGGHGGAFAYALPLRPLERRAGGDELLRRAVWAAIDVADRLFDGRKSGPEAGRRTRHGMRRRCSAR